MGLMVQDSVHACQRLAGAHQRFWIAGDSKLPKRSTRFKKFRCRSMAVLYLTSILVSFALLTFVLRPFPLCRDLAEGELELCPL